MQTIITQVSPKLAAEWLEKVVPEQQRPLSDRTVELYAKAMGLGHWVLTHQGIAFDENGALCDGQHRLHAVVRSGVTVRMVVTTGVPVIQENLYTFDAIDRGRLRGVAMQLQVRHGVKDANKVAAAARTIATICTRNSITFSVPSALAVLDRFGESIEKVLRSYKLPCMQTGAAVGTAAFCLRAMPKELYPFVEAVGSGENLKKGQPAYALREYLLHRTKAHGLLAASEKPTATCAMHYVLGNRVSQLKTSMVGVDFFCDKQPRIVEEIAGLF